MFHVKHRWDGFRHWRSRVLDWIADRITDRPAIVLPEVVIPPDVPRETSRPAYKELMMKRDHFLLLRNEIKAHLDSGQEIYGIAEIKRTAIDPDTGDLLVTAQFGLGDRATVRTHRIRITEESDE